VLKRDADDKGGLYLLALAYQQKGRRAEALGLFERVYALDKLLGAAPLGYSYARAGRADEALRLLGELDEFSKQSFVPSQESALIYIGLGDSDRAFAMLRKAREEHTPSFPFIMVDPLFDSIRSDPRDPELVRGANLPL
jgi:tetratricopeptide (TPR) repeat protein